MPRRARVVVPGVPHHVTERGVRRSEIFLEPADREFYLRGFDISARHFGLSVRSYCLMTNHVHFVVVPERTDSISRTFHRIHSVYGSWFNQKYEKSGYLFDDRPRSAPLDEDHYWASLRYVERNPVRARMVLRAEDYPWSSAAAHCGTRSDPILDRVWTPDLNTAEWAAWLLDEGSEEEYKRIRDRTFDGRPCGSDAFVHEIESRLGMSFARKKPGPKKKPTSLDQLTLPES